MTALAVASTQQSPGWTIRTAETTRVVTRVTARRCLRPAMIWGAGLGLYVGIQAATYASTYKTPAQRAKLASTISGMQALVGPGRHLDTVAGYTAWKCLMAVSLVAAIWGALTSTRLLRGEEDSGRWEVLLSGRTTPGGATAQVAASFGAAIAGMLVSMAVVVAVFGRAASVHIGASAAIFFSCAVVASSAMFLSVGMLTSQLAANRRQASLYAAAVLGASFILRLLADTISGVSWMGWLSPLGWLERTRPLTGSDGLPFALVAALIAVCVTASVRLASRRDLGASTFADHTDAEPRLRLLGSSLGLAIRLMRMNAFAWLAGASVLAALLGSEATLAAKSIADSSSANKVLARLGGTQGVTKAYLAVSFVLLVVVIILAVINQVSAARREESEGRLDVLLSQPVSRVWWLGGRSAVAAAWVLAMAMVMGLVVGVSTVGQHIGVAWASFFEAGLNTVPPALVILGVGVFFYGARPRYTSAVLYGYLAWSFLVELVSAGGSSTRLLLDTSVIHQMAASPAHSPNWVSAGVMTLIAAALACAGLVAFSRRDLVGD